MTISMIWNLRHVYMMTRFLVILLIVVLASRVPFSLWKMLENIVLFFVLLLLPGCRVEKLAGLEEEVRRGHGKRRFRDLGQHSRQYQP